MNRMTRVQGWMAGLAVGVLAALALAPATSYIVRPQVRMAVTLQPPARTLAYLGLRGAPTSVVRDMEVRTEEFARAHPNELEVQLAAAMDRRPHATPTEFGVEGNGAGRTVHAAESIRPLKERFPGNAALLANLLRIATLNDLRSTCRPEEYIFESAAVEPKVPPAPSSGTLEAFDRDAEEGESAEPDNAYFPFMRSVGLFAANRDDEAISAIERAGSKLRWEEHYGAEVMGRFRIMEEALGEQDGISRIAVAAALLLPQYAALRSATRVAVAEAIEMEKAGENGRAFNIRRNLARCGALMRVQARTLIGSLVGMAITRMAITRPAGAEAIRPARPVTTETERAARRKAADAYCAHLRRIGHPEEQAWVRAEFDAMERVRTLAKPYPAALDIGVLVADQGTRWMSNLALLGNALWMLLAGGVATLALRNRSLRAGRPLPVSTRFGALSGASIAVAAWSSAGISPQSTLGFIYAAGVATLFLMVVAIMRPRTGWLSALKAFLVAAAAISLVAALCAWHFFAATPLASIWYNMIGPDVGLPHTLGGVVAYAAWVVPVAPIAIILLAATVSRICRVPATAGCLRALRGLAIPTTAAIVLAYAVSVIPTVRADMNARVVVDSFLDHEGKAIAAILHAEWPGFVDHD